MIKKKVNLAEHLSIQAVISWWECSMTVELKSGDWLGYCAPPLCFWKKCGLPASQGCESSVLKAISLLYNYGRIVLSLISKAS